MKISKTERARLKGVRVPPRKAAERKPQEREPFKLDELPPVDLTPRNRRVGAANPWSGKA